MLSQVEGNMNAMKQELELLRQLLASQSHSNQSTNKASDLKAKNLSHLRDDDSKTDGNGSVHSYRSDVFSTKSQK